MLLKKNKPATTAKMYAFRHDLHTQLPPVDKEQLDISTLSPFQRVILKTDGTLTEILEAYLLEKIHISKLLEEVIPAPKAIPALNIKAGREIMDRRILLYGQLSKNNWIYAKSIVVPDRMNPDFRHELIESRRPIGRLWLKYKMETYREVISAVREPAGELAQYFAIDEQANLLSRTYLVYYSKKPVIIITEKFPEHYFATPI